MQGKTAQSPKIASVVRIFGAKKKTVGDGVDGPFFGGKSKVEVKHSSLKNCGKNLEFRTSCLLIQDLR